MEKTINEQLGYIRPGRVNGSIEMAGLFDKWYHRTVLLSKDMTDDYGHYGLVCDGLMRKPNKDEKDDCELEKRWWEQPMRIAFLMKDQNQKGSVWTDDSRNWLSMKEDMQQLTNKTYRHIANIFWGLLHATPQNICPSDLLNEKFDEIKTCFNTIPFAYIECKKQGGGPRLDDKVLELYLNDYRDLLYEEFDILKPNVFVCTGWPIYEFVKEYIMQKYGNDSENILTEVPSLNDKRKSEQNILLHRPSKTIILLGFHPGAIRYKYDMGTIYGGIMNHYHAFLQSEYYHDFFK